ncbi:MAG: autotransporter-associated beta strand repeat-containing protein [Collimonas sp.]
MNKIYRIVFNHVTGAWVAVAETAKGRTKSKTSSVVSASPAAWDIRPIALSALWMIAAPIVQAQTMSFPSTQTIDIGGTTTTITGLTVSNNVAGTLNGAGGTLIYTGATGPFNLGGTASVTQQTLDMSGLSNFVYDNATTIFSVGGRASGGAANTTGLTNGTLTLAAQNNTITASTFGVGNVSRSVQGPATNVGTVYLGQNNTINADRIFIGASQASGNMSFQSGVTDGKLVLRGTDGNSPVSNWNIGVGNNSNYSATASNVDLSAGSLDAKVSNLTIATGVYGNTIATGALTIGSGTLDADNIILGQRTSTVVSGNNNGATGTLTVKSGGTVTAHSMMLGDRSGGTYGSATGVLNVNGGTVSAQTMTLGNGASGSGTVNINSGGTLQAGTIQRGGTGTINWNDGAIANLADGADTRISGANIVLANTGTHTFEIDGDNALASVSSIISGAGGTLAKAGSGVLALTANNTYTGGTTVNDGLVNFQSLANFGTGNITLDGGGLQWGAGVTTDVSARLDALGANGAILDTNGNNVTLAANLSGADGSLIKNGAGTLTLTGENTYDGTTTINTGTLQIGNGGTTGNIAGDVLNNAALVVDRSDTMTLSGAISGNGSLTQAGTGTTVLTGDNTYSGGTTINAGTLQIGDGGTSGSIAGNVTNNGALIVDRSDALTYGGVVSGAGSLTQAGAGTTTLTGANTYTGGTQLNAGVLNVGSDANLGAVAGGLTFNGGVLQASGSFTSDRAVTLNTSGTIDTQANSNTLTGVIAGAGALVKEGSGTLTLAGVNTYEGGTNLNAGVLNVSADANLGAAAGGLTFNGGTLQTSSSFTSDRAVTLNTSGTLDTQSNSNTLAGVIAGPGALVKEGSGTLTLTGDNTYSGGTTINTGTLQIGNGGTTGSIAGDVNNNGSLVVERSDAMTLSGAIAGNGSLTQAGPGTTVLTGDNTYTGGTTINVGALQIGDGGVSGSIAGNVTNNGALAFSRSDALTFSGVISGTGSLTQAGTGMTTLTGAGSSVGSTNVTAGTLNLAQPGSFTNTGNYTTSGGATTQVAADSTLAVSGVLTQAAGSTLGVDINGNRTQPAITANTANLSGTINIAGYTAPTPPSGDDGLIGTQVNIIRTTGGITNDFTSVNVGGSSSPVDYLSVIGSKSADGLDYNVGLGLTWFAGAGQGNGVFTLANSNEAFNVGVALNDQPASGAPWNGTTLTKNGEGTLTLSGANTYTGGTVINAGTLQIGNGGTSGSIVGDVTNNGTLAFNRSDALTYDGIVSGTGALTQAGSGTLTLTGANTYEGGTNLNAGVLNVGADANLGAATGGLTFNGGTLQTANSFTSDRTVMLNTSGTIDTQANSNTLTGVISGAGTLAKQGSGTLILAGDNTYSGGTTINAGTLQIGNGGTSGSIAGDVNNNGSLVVDRSDTMTLSGIISGTGSLAQSGTGTTILAGDSTYSGDTTINAGTLQIGNGGTSGSIVGNVLNNGALIVDRSDAVLVPGVISGTGSLTQKGDGTAVLAADNTYTGATTIEAGTLQLGNGGTTGSVIGDITNNGTLSFNRSDTVTFDKQISGTGGVVQAGSGTLNLEGAQTYTGPTTVSNGTLAVNGSITSDTTVAPAGTLAGVGTIIGNVENQGAVRPGSAMAGSTNYGTLTIQGNYAGAGGALVLNTYLGADGSPTDRLIIDGGVATGTTGVRVNNTNLGAAGYTTADGIEVISAANGGSTGSDAFKLVGGARSGFSDYRLFQGGLNGSHPENWYMRNTFTPPVPPDPVDPVDPVSPPDPADEILPPGTYPIIGPTLATYGAVQPVARQLGLLSLGTRHERAGEDGAQNAAASPIGWGRVYNSHVNNRYQSYASPDVQGNMAGFQVGADLWRGANDAARQDSAGVYAAFSNATMNVDGMVTNAEATGYVRERTGRLNLDAWAGGAYWTHYGADGWYLDAVLQATHYSGSASTQSASLNTAGLGLLGSLEAGYGFSLPQFGPGFNIEPQAQLVWQRVRFDTQNDGLGDVALGTTTGLSGRVGVRAKWKLESANGQVWEPSLVTNLWQDWGTRANTVYSGTATAPLLANGGRIAVGGGLATKVARNFSLYTNATYQFALNDADGKKRDSINATVGVRFTW